MAKRVNVRFPDELYGVLMEICVRREETLNGVVMRMLWDHEEVRLSQKGAKTTPQAMPKRHQNDTVLAQPVDARHKEVRELIMKLHENKFKVECPWGAGEAGQLGQLLKTIPGVTVEQLGVMVRNRFRSEGVAPERPMGWIGNLTKYGAGPLDKFGKTKLELQPEPVKYLQSRYPPEMMEEIRKANEE